MSAGAESSVRIPTPLGTLRPTAGTTIPVRTDPTQMQSRERLHRLVDRWIQADEPGLLARIVVLQHGGHQRPVITRGGKHQRQRDISQKTGLTQVGEGRGEQLFTMWNEVWGHVVDYQNHPFVMKAIRRDRRFSYRPDALRQLRDGTIELIEVKRTPDDLRDPELREMLAVVAEIARRCGWTFRILYLEDIIGPPPRIRNVEAVYGRRSMALTGREIRVADAATAKNLPVTWAAIRDRLCPADPLRGDAAIECLIARGRLLVDFDARFTPNTVLQPVAAFAGASDIRL